MREIKYRGQKLESYEWVYGGAYGTSKRAWIVEVTETEYGREITKVEVKPYTIGQFIGIWDMFEEDIYEGDILQLWRSQGENGQLRGEYAYPLPVVYEQLWSQFVVEDKAIKENYKIWECFQRYKVIGNIHDTPELMG